MKTTTKALFLVVLLCLPWVGRAQYSLTVADGTSPTLYAPVNFSVTSNSYVYSQIVYDASMLTQLLNRRITGLRFYANNPGVSDYKVSHLKMKVCIKAIDSYSGLSSSYLTTTNETTVIDSADISIYKGVVTIMFNTDFTYLNGNLLISFQSKEFDQMIGNYQGFLGMYYSGTRMRTGYGTGSNVNNYTSTAMSFLPKTTFLYENLVSPAHTHWFKVNGGISGLSTQSVYFSWGYSTDQQSYIISNGFRSQSVTGCGTVFTGLNAGTMYEFTLRRVTTSGDTTGPSYLYVRTLDAPTAPATYYTNFNYDPGSNWSIRQSTGSNRWYIGNNASSAYGSMYISDDCSSYHYDSTGNISVSVAYRKIRHNPKWNSYLASFDWKGNGESTYDFMRVAYFVKEDSAAFMRDDSLMNWRHNYIAQTESNSIALDGGTKLNLNSSWTTRNTYFYDFTTNDGDDFSWLAFYWKNDGNIGTQPPAAVDNVRFQPVVSDYSHSFDFEENEEDSPWVLENCYQSATESINRWCIGTSATGNNNKSLYITNDSATYGYAYSYNTTSYVVAHTAIALNCEDNAKYHLSYDWKCGGEANHDYLRAWLVPATVKVDPYMWDIYGAPQGCIAIDGGNKLCGSQTWQKQQVVFEPQYTIESNIGFSTSVYRLVFYWRNDNSSGTTPAAIDNIQYSMIVDTSYFETVFSDQNQYFCFTGQTQTNHWVIGYDTSYYSSRALYITDQNSNLSNSEYHYTGTDSSRSGAYIVMHLEAGDYEFRYKWLCNGEGSFDYMRSAIIPANVSVSQNLYFTKSVLPSGWTALDGGNGHSGSTTWQTRTGTTHISTPGYYKIVFLWRNDYSVANQPPAAVDSLYFKKIITCPQPNVYADNIGTNSAQLHWSSTGSASQWILDFNGSQTTFNTNSHSVSGLTANTEYTYRVRAICGAGDSSYWSVGTFHTTKAAPIASLPYNTGFENTSENNAWVQIDNGQPNKWCFGTATNNGGSKAIYVSMNNGTSNIYDTTDFSISYAYNTFALVPGTYNISFDWRCFGEYFSDNTAYDYMAVTLLPESVPLHAGVAYRPKVGTTTQFSHTPLPNEITFTPTLFLGSHNTYSSIDTSFTITTAGNYKLVITWRNDAIGGNNPAGALDNLSLDLDAPAVIPPVATFPYSHDFENNNENPYWTRDNGGANNKWAIGSATNNSGSKALYISNDNGTSNAYTISGETSAVFAWREFTMQSGDYSYCFDWKANGESNWDFLRVALVPSNVTLTSSSWTTSSLPSAAIALDGGSQLVGTTSWTTQSGIVSIPSTGNYKLVFYWKNDNSMGNQPPAAIDNITIDRHIAPVTTLPYTCNFETSEASNWKFANDNQTNAWVYGTNVNNGGSHSMYISSNGTSNTYSVDDESDVYVYRSFVLDSGDYRIAFEWRANGESSWDYLQAVFITASQPLQGGYDFWDWFTSDYVMISHNELGQDFLNQSTSWSTFVDTIHVSTNDTFNLAFYWRNDDSYGSQPPAAIDNISVSVVQIQYFTVTTAANNSNWGTVTGGGSYPAGTTVTLQAYPSDNYHFVSWNDGNTDNPRTITVTSNITYTATFAQNAPNQYTVTVSSNNNNWGTVSGGGNYNAGSTATITATPAEHCSFVQWNDGNTTNPRSFTVNSNVTYTATFVQDSFIVNVTSNNNSWGTAAGGGSYVYGATATLTATPASGYYFVSWNDGNSSNPRNVTVTGNITYTATFAQNAPTQYTLTVLSNNTAWGTVTGGGNYNAGSTATLTATPAANCHFISWNDGNTNATRTVTVNANATYTATFAQDTFTVTVTSNNNAWGTVTGGGEYVYGATATLVAGAASGYHFVSWNDGNTENPRSVTVTGDITYTANFAEDAAPQYTITVVSADETMGTVSGGGTFDAGTDISISATANEGYHFVNWDNGSTDNPLSVTVTEDATYTAIFAQDDAPQYTITVVSADETMGTVSGGGTFDAGTVITITATANEGYRFVSWDNGSTDNPLSVTVTEDATYTATFEAQQIGIIDAIGQNAKVTIYPNPTSSNATIEIYGMDGLLNVTIVDMNGRTVYSGQHTTDSGDKTQLTLDVSNLAAGSYLVRVSDNSVQSVSRLIVR